MAKPKPNSKQASGIKGMKLIAIKQECYAIACVETVLELRKKYVTLCQKSDFRLRKTWENLLKNLRAHGDWIGIKVAKIAPLAPEQSYNPTTPGGLLTFRPERVAMDRSAENDD
jgi:hypothetical protein